MTTGMTLNDRSIQTPAEDRYELNPLAAALARSIAGMSAPEGVVLAINGPWGSGKSGVINLVLHHLRSGEDGGRVHVIRFSPWWFTGPEPLTRAFFEALNIALGNALPGKVKKKAAEAVNALFQRIRPAKQFGAVGANVAAGAPVGTAAVAAMDLGMEYLGAKRSVESEYDRLAEVLREQSLRFLIVIDDIDRLDPEDAILVFRLVKSVGQLPNVVYLLAFHREVADRHLRRRFESSADEYLEKIVQVSYEIPVPSQSALLRSLLAATEASLPPPETPVVTTRFGNLIHDCVAPWLRTPRDVVRLANAIHVGWPAVANEVDPADFVALEGFKLAHPGVYRSVLTNPQALCGTSPSRSRELENIAKRYDEMLLHTASEKEWGALRTALRRLFPRLDAVWGNLWHDALSAQEWHRHRLVCDRAHFDTYFRLAPGEHVVPAAELRDLLLNITDVEYVCTAFRRALTIKRETDGSTRASLLLDELTTWAGEIAESSVSRLLEALFAIADDLDVPEDEDHGLYQIGNNHLRLHWLLLPLVLDRFELEERSRLLNGAAKHAQPAWLVDLAERCIRALRPRQESRDEPLEPLVDDRTAAAMRKLGLKALRDTANFGNLLTHRRLRSLLHAWADLAEDDGAQVRRWTKAQLMQDSAIVLLAEAFTHTARSASIGDGHSLGDRVATVRPIVDRVSVTRVCDLDRLTARVEQLRAGDIDPERKVALDRFIEGLSAEQIGPRAQL